jgi:hypothetical protein
VWSIDSVRDAEPNHRGAVIAPGHLADREVLGRDRGRDQHVVDLRAEPAGRQRPAGRATPPTREIKDHVQALLDLLANLERQ